MIEGNVMDEEDLANMLGTMPEGYPQDCSNLDLPAFSCFGLLRL